MVKAVLLVAVALALSPTTANACDNAVEWTTDDYVRVVIKAEKFLEQGQYGRAKKTLGRMKFPTAALTQRAADVRAVIKLRMPTAKDDLAAATVHLKSRVDSKSGASDVRFRAWLAEAYVASGDKDAALAILVDLEQRDLMPDAYAYLALAKLKTGTERLAAWKACRTRAKNKDLCELPTAITTQARK
jgi:ATP/maltotriose-dependent transcriptional regulator MalT